jgi:hypothetical protein
MPFVLVDRAEGTFFRAALAGRALYQHGVRIGHVPGPRMHRNAPGHVVHCLDRLERRALRVINGFGHVHGLMHRAGGIDAGPAGLVLETNEV